MGMVTIRALPDGGERELECLGEARLLKGVPAGEMRVLKPVSIPGAGSYEKEFPAPLYRREELEVALGPSRGRCLGVLARRGKRPRGYLRRRLGPHELCIPVYPAGDFSPFLWKTAGYLPAGGDYAAVVRRRVGYWVWLFLAAALAFGLSYLFFTQGPEPLLATLRDLPMTLSDAWYRLLRQLGLV